MSALIIHTIFSYVVILVVKKKQRLNGTENQPTFKLADWHPGSIFFPGSDDLGNMFQFYRDFDEECNRSRDVQLSKELNPELQSFETWLKESQAAK